MGKKGQVTIFVILGILIVIAGLLIYFFMPNIKSTFTGLETNPETYLQNCIEDDLLDSTLTLAKQGGEFDPQKYYLFEDTKVNYLCYTSNYYDLCVVQQPFLREHFQEELTQAIQPTVDSCFEELKEDYSNRNYDVQMTKGDIQVKILPQRIDLEINNSLSLSKKEVLNYDSFNVVLNNNLYQVLAIMESIVEHESVLGQAETTDFMTLYRNMKVEKLKQTEGTKIYKITDRTTEDVYMFASRSQVFPPGYY